MTGGLIAPRCPIPLRDCGRCAVTVTLLPDSPQRQGQSHNRVSVSPRAVQCHTRPVDVVPTGVVTFLFTDVEGSTRRWERDAAEMRVALAEHDAVVRDAIGRHGGYVFATGGDSVAAAFTDPVHALRAAIDAQSEVPLPVRFGLHTGTADSRDGDYFGPTLNRTARIMAAGHGGQILVSDATAGLVRDEVGLTDLGERRFRDLVSPIRVWQVGSESFPALRTMSSAVGNLPVQLDSFVGREREVAVLVELIAASRLVTVLGAGGMGKTRLALEAGRRLRHDVAEGVWFVDLSPVRSDSGVVDQVAAALGVRPAQGRSIEERLVEHLEDRAALLIVDNCEQVVETASRLMERLLVACADLRVVATSREALEIRGEQVMAIDPLSTGEGSDGHSGGDASALFIERALAHGPTFLDDDERAAVKEICRRLDGMPLAIELAAARSRSLGVTGVLDRLSERLALLTASPRSEVERHQTLRATLDWSYALLSVRERTVFDRLGIFVGSFNADDAIGVAAVELSEVEFLDALSGLVSRSMCLVDTTQHPARYRYLDTTRAYARDHLADSGMLSEYRTRHARYFGGIAARACLDFVGPREVDAATDIDDHALDLHAALMWGVDQHLDDIVGTCAALAAQQAVRGALAMVGWFDELRDQPDLPSAARIAILCHTFFSKGDLTESEQLAQDLIDEDDESVTRGALEILGWVSFYQGDTEAALQLQERKFADLEDDQGIAWAGGAWSLAMILAICRLDTRGLPRKIIDRSAEFGWRTGEAQGYYALAIELERIDPAASLEAYNRALQIAIDVGNRQVEGLARRGRMSLLPLEQLSVELIDLLRYLQTNDDRMNVIGVLSRAAEVLHQNGREDAAATVCGWLDGRIGRTVDASAEFLEVIAQVKDAVGASWEQLVEEGRAMTAAEITDHACAGLASTTNDQ